MRKSESASKPFLWAMGLVLTGVVAGCSGGGDGGSGTAPSAQPGTLSVSLTDAPACGFDEVNVTVSKVRVHQSSSADDNAAGWTDITLNPARKINLLNLNDPTQPNFALETLGETPLAAGHYTQVRLVLVPNSGSPNPPFANSIVLEGQAQEIKLDTPSAVQSGIKLVNEFDVPSGQRVDLLLDFDACHSIVQTGNGKYKLKPVIKVIPTQLNGINGFVDKTLPNVRVSAQQGGVIKRETVMNTQTGEFFLAHLDPGNYDVVITADNHATAVIAGVPVPNLTVITPVSTNALPAPPIKLGQDPSPKTISGTVTLSPLSATDETVFVAAKQTFGSSPTVTVKSRVAVSEVDAQNNPTGNYPYTLTLPIAAPSLGQYATPLPITLTPQSTVAKKYAIEASAAGYLTKSLNFLDITAVNTPQDFTLTP